MTRTEMVEHPPDQRSLPPPPRSLLCNASLFLDFDGTLVNIADTPDAVEVTQELRDLVRFAFERLAGRVAIISGRPIAQIDALLGIEGLAVSGSHGLELRNFDGKRSAPARPPTLDRAARALRRATGTLDGVLIEEKPFGVALHYRRAPEAEADCLAAAGSAARAADLVLQPGKMVIEARVPGPDKGKALELLMDQRRTRDTRPVFAGDDVTDEAAFAAAGRLGGTGILVGPARATAAGYRVDGVEELLDWARIACAAA
jgi:trehalose 6-phosphate phosphatase